MLTWLIQGLEHDNKEVRSAASNALNSFGGRMQDPELLKPLVEIGLKLSANADPEGRSQGLRILSSASMNIEQGPILKSILQRLLELLKDKEDAVRIAAAEAISPMSDKF